MRPLDDATQRTKSNSDGTGDSGGAMAGIMARFQASDTPQADEPLIEPLRQPVAAEIGKRIDRTALTDAAFDDAVSSAARTPHLAKALQGGITYAALTLARDAQIAAEIKSSAPRIHNIHAGPIHANGRGDTARDQAHDPDVAMAAAGGRSAVEQMREERRRLARNDYSALSTGTIQRLQNSGNMSVGVGDSGATTATAAPWMRATSFGNAGLGGHAQNPFGDGMPFRGNGVATNSPSRATNISSTGGMVMYRVPQADTASGRTPNARRRSIIAAHRAARRSMSATARQVRMPASPPTPSHRTPKAMSCSTRRSTTRC